MNPMIRVMTVDDHPLIRQGLRLMLTSNDDFIFVGDAADGETALQRIEETQPDVVLLDIRMPGMDGLEVLVHIQKAWPRIAVLLLTTYDDDELMIRGLQSGAYGYLLKESPLEALSQAIRTAARGEVVVQPEMMTRILAHTQSTPSSTNTIPSYMELTKREQAVLTRVARGERSKEIAAHLGITERTVRAYLTNIYTKLNVDSRSSAVAVAMKKGLI